MRRSVRTLMYNPHAYEDSAVAPPKSTFRERTQVIAFQRREDWTGQNQVASFLQIQIGGDWFDFPNTIRTRNGDHTTDHTANSGRNTTLAETSGYEYGIAIYSHVPAGRIRAALGLVSVGGASLQRHRLIAEGK